MGKKYYIILLSLSFLFLLTVNENLMSQTINKLKWINFSPYTIVGQDPEILSAPVPDSTQIVSLLDKLVPYAEGIRTFGTLHPLDSIPYYAKQRGFNVMVGIYLSPNDTVANAVQIMSGIAIANAGWADKIIVGSEALFHGLSPQKLIAYINYVKSSCPSNIEVSCADIYSYLITNPAVINACDFVFPNIYPFWEGVPIECAMQRFNQDYLSLKAAVQNKPIIISESGWKTFGAFNIEAEPSISNASRYDRELLGWSKAYSTDVNIFEAFDEPWKTIYHNDGGWGIFDSLGNMKPGMDTLFKPFVNIDSTWLCKKLNNTSNQDTLYIDYMPYITSFLDIKGHVDHINTCDYKITTFIKVYGQWWIKPTYNNPSVPILCNGDWQVDYTTGGMDQMASDICVFLIPYNYPDSLLASDGLNAAYQNAVDLICIHRDTLQDATLTASSDTICYGSPDTLTAFTTSMGAHYLWNTGDTTASIIVTPEVNNADYTVTISTGPGIGSILKKSIFLIYAPLFAWIIDDKYMHCLGDTVALRVFTIGIPHLKDFLWSTGETNDTILVSPSITTIYSVTATTNEGCITSTTCTVHIDTSDLKIIASHDTIRRGEISQLSLSGGATKYLWSTGATDPEIFVSPQSTTSYSLTFTDMWGCSFQSQTTVIVDTEGITETTVSNFSINPNPTQNILQIKCPATYSKEITFSILNSFGQVLVQNKRKQFSNDVLYYDISNLASGIYFLKMTTDKEIITKKFIKD